MAILPGKRLGPYEILSSIGAGWARCIRRTTPSSAATWPSTSLPEAFAYDPERLLNFQREAKMLDSLNK
jgi:hypothetical protein